MEFEVFVSYTIKGKQEKYIQKYNMEIKQIKELIKYLKCQFFI